MTTSQLPRELVWNLPFHVQTSGPDGIRAYAQRFLGRYRMLFWLTIIVSILLNAFLWYDTFLAGESLFGERTLFSLISTLAMWVLLPIVFVISIRDRIGWYTYLSSIPGN